MGRNNVRLNCAVDGASNRDVRWYSVQDLEDGIVPSRTPAVASGSQISVSSSDVGFWWCSVVRETSDAEKCSTVAALHIYECICNDDLQIDRVCPANTRRSGVCTLALSSVCRTSQTLLCVTSTQLPLLPTLQPSTSAAKALETANDHFPTTHISTATKTLGISHQASTSTTVLFQSNHRTTPGHAITTATAMLPQPSGTSDTDNETRVHGLGLGMVQLLLYIVGPVVAFVAVSIVLLLLILICCLHYRRNKKSTFGSGKVVLYSMYC